MDKVIINSLPKSGTHLLARFCQLIGLEENSENLARGLIRQSNFNLLRNLNVNLRRITYDSDLGVSIDLEDMNNRIKKSYLNKYLKNIKDKTYIKAHLPYTKKLECVLIENNFKILFIIRDPRDVVLSFVNWTLNNPSHPEYDILKNLSINEAVIYSFTRKYKKKYYKRDSFINRINKIDGWLNSNSVCSLRFEDLIGERGGGKEIDQINTVKKILSFLEIKDDSTGMIIKNLFYTKAKTFHKGQIGSWEKVFEKQTIDIFNKHIGQFIEKLNYG